MLIPVNISTQFWPYANVIEEHEPSIWHISAVPTPQCWWEHVSVHLLSSSVGQGEEEVHRRFRGRESGEEHRTKGSGFSKREPTGLCGWSVREGAFSPRPPTKSASSCLTSFIVIWARGFSFYHVCSFFKEMLRCGKVIYKWLDIWVMFHSLFIWLV